MKGELLIWKQNLQKIALVLIVLLGTSMSLAFPNPYQLSLEDQLAVRFYAEILPLWERQTERGQFQGDGGINIHYSLTRAVTPLDKIIFISPGRTEGYMKYQELAIDLSKQGYDIAIIDHRGQGFSDRTSNIMQLGDVESYDHYVSDLKKLFEQLTQAHQYSHKFFLGHSMGCAIGALYMQLYPNDFNAAVFSSPMFGIELGPIPDGIAVPLIRILARFDNTWYKHPRFALGQGPYRNKAFVDNPLTHSKIRYQIFRNVYAAQPELQIGGPSNRWLSHSFKAMNKIIKRASSMKTPTLLLQAGGDTVVSSHRQKQFCSARANTDTPCASGGVVTIAKAKHELFIEQDPQRLEALTKVLDFYAAQP